MKSMQPKIGNTLWGVWEHRYYNEKRLVELEYVVYPVKITRFFKGKYVDAHCVGVDVDGHTAVHWVAVKSIGLDTDQGTLRELTADELPDADRLPDGEYV